MHLQTANAPKRGWGGMVMNPDPKATETADLSSRVFRRETTSPDSQENDIFHHLAQKFLRNWRLLAEIVAVCLLTLVVFSVLAAAASSPRAQEKLSGRKWRRAICCLMTSIGWIIMFPLLVIMPLHIMVAALYNFCIGLFRKDGTPRPSSSEWISKIYLTPFTWWDECMVSLFAPSRSGSRGIGLSLRQNRNRDEEEQPPRYTPYLELSDMPPASTLERATLPTTTRTTLRA